MANPGTCPKCGRKVDATAFICPGCEYILDTSFLGDDITDDERDRRPPARPAGDKRRLDFGEDAIILGNSDGEWSDFSSRDAGGMTREVTQARFYIGGSTAALLHEDAVPEQVPGVSPAALKLTPFEEHLLQFMNGKRSMGRIQKKSGMEDAEFKASVAMLSDKGVIRLRTVKKKKKGKDGLSRSESSRGAPAASALEGERTMVAPTPLEPSVPRRPALSEPERSSRSESGHSEVTALKNVEQKKSRLPGMASVRLLDDEKIEDGGRVEAFGEGERGGNLSNVFARASVPPMSRATLASAVAKEAPRPAKEPSRVVEKSAVRGAPARPTTTSALNERTPSLPAEEVESVSLLPPGGDQDFADELDRGGAEADGFERGAAPGELDTDQRELHKRRTEPAPSAELDVEPDAALDAEADASDRLFDDEVSGPTALGSLRPVAPVAGAAEDDDEEAADQGRADAGRADAERAAQDAEEAAFEDEWGGPTGEPALPAAAAEDEQQDDDEDQELDSRVVGTRPMIHEERTAALPPLSDAPTGPAPARAAADDESDDQGESSFASTSAASPAAAREHVAEHAEEHVDEHIDEDAEGFEVDLRTAALDAKVEGQSTGPAPPPIPELPSDALQPLPSAVHKAPAPVPAAAPPAPAPAPWVPPSSQVAAPPPIALPGQALTRPAASPVAPTRPGVAAPAARPAPASPGPQRPPTVGGGGLTARPSQQSKVPFEQARKAEKIFEQAIKDHAEGRLSSARMNVKLAVMYDPSVPAYQEFLAELDRAGAGAKSPNASKPRELLLFEQASEKEGKGDYDGAVKLLMEAIETAPRAAALRNRLGVVLSIRLKRHEEALAHLKVAIELEPGNIVYMNNYSKVTAMLDSELEKGPERHKGKKGDGQDKIAIKKMRPKMF